LGMALSCTQNLFSSTQIQVSSNQLTFSASAPPAIFYIEDSQGHRSGADPLAVTNNNGQQVTNRLGLQEIPSSATDQDNESSGDFDSDNDANIVPNSTTMWSVDIYDGGAQTYTLNVKGIESGIEQISVGGILTTSHKVVKNLVSVLITKGELRQMTVAFNPAANILTFQRIVKPGDLVSDVKAACQLNQITSAHVCKRLEEKAEAIQDALGDHHEKEAKELVKSFLHFLGDSRPVGCKDNDDHDAIQEPALTILVEDAKALLKSLENTEGNQH